MRRLLIGLVTGAAVVAVLASGGSSGDSGGSDASGSSAPTSEADSGDAAGGTVGQPVRDGKFEFVVDSVECGVKKVGPELLEEKAQGQFCLVKMTVENIGDEAQLFDVSSQKGATDSGATVDSDTTASIVLPENEDVFLEEINPGNSINVTVVFDIAKDQKLTSLELHDSVLSNGVTVAIP